MTKRTELPPPLILPKGAAVEIHAEPSQPDERNAGSLSDWQRYCMAVAETPVGLRDDTPARLTGYRDADEMILRMEYLENRRQLRRLETLIKSLAGRMMAVQQALGKQSRQRRPIDKRTNRTRSPRCAKPRTRTSARSKSRATT